jgi:steroid delta-isomerase-like uncharacterized protein
LTVIDEGIPYPSSDIGRLKSCFADNQLRLFRIFSFICFHTDLPRIVKRENTMTTEKNKLTMQRFTEFINTASEQMAAELISPIAIFHVPGRDEPMIGPSGYLSVIAMMRAGFPDIQWTLEELIAEGDKIAARFTMRGTHEGAFFGVPPTGRKIEVQAMNFYRFEKGQIVEERGQPDLLGLLQQINAVPA